jgi:acyl carrier protein
LIREIRKKTVQIIQDLSNEDTLHISDETRLVEDLGFDSLSMITFIIELEHEFDVEIPTQEMKMENFETVEKTIYFLCNLKGDEIRDQ